MFHGFSRILGPGALAKRQLENPQQDDRPEIHPWNFTETLLLLSRQCGNGMIVNSNYGSFPHFPHFLLSTVRKSQGKASFLKWAWAWWDNVEYIYSSKWSRFRVSVSRGVFLCDPGGLFNQWWPTGSSIPHRFHIFAACIRIFCRENKLACLNLSNRT